MKFKGTHYDLVYNAAAHFAAQERYPQGLLTAINETSTASFHALCWAVEELAKQGELVHRAMGHEAAQMITQEEIATFISFSDVIQIKTEVLQAISNGLQQRTAKPNEEIDLGLIELQKKTELTSL